MIDLEYWSCPFKQESDEFFAAYLTSKKIIVPLAEDEVFYKDWVYKISGEALEGLCDARKVFGVPLDFKGTCKTVKKARDVNGYFMACLRSIKNEIENSEKEGRISETVIKIRHV